ncbi:hypothetical protein HMPREF9720_2343 [Alistipes sp. HGB5]|nr:hypothetical protein HMPREF9720_2343 [Alistipes sp. HGB5]
MFGGEVAPFSHNESNLINFQDNRERKATFPRKVGRFLLEKLCINMKFDNNAYNP